MNAVAVAALDTSLIFLAYSAIVAPLRAGDGLVRFTNETRQPIVELHVSAAGAGDWQRDLLGSDYLLPGASVLVPIADPNEGCRIDVKMVLDDGSERIRQSVDLGRTEGWVATLRWPI
jgi:hypothetical protein